MKEIRLKRYDRHRTAEYYDERHSRRYLLGITDGNENLIYTKRTDPVLWYRGLNSIIAKSFERPKWANRVAYIAWGGGCGGQGAGLRVYGKGGDGATLHFRTEELDPKVTGLYVEGGEGGSGGNYSNSLTEAGGPGVTGKNTIVKFVGTDRKEEFPGATTYNNNDNGSVYQFNDPVEHANVYNYMLLTKPFVSSAGVRSNDSSKKNAKWSGGGGAGNPGLDTGERRGGNGGPGGIYIIWYWR